MHDTIASQSGSKRHALTSAWHTPTDPEQFRHCPQSPFESHAIEQAPFTHMAPVGHGAAQPPQFDASLLVSTHAPPHSVSPGAQPPPAPLELVVDVDEVAVVAEPVVAPCTDVVVSSPPPPPPPNVPKSDAAQPTAATATRP